MKTLKTKWMLAAMLLMAFTFAACGSDDDDEKGVDAPKFQTQTITVGGVSFKMIAVEGGTFQMGSPESDAEADGDEKPWHQVTLSNYYIGETEVTQELWEAVMGSNPSYFVGPKLPVDKVSWDDCQAFIGKLNAQTGKTFRLPTEAEWEYAARGGKKSKGYTYSGSNTIAEVAWYGKNSNNETHDVALKAPNELGIYDMSGNVGEWCQDRFGNYGKEDEINPIGSNTGSNRVLRGGSYGDKEEICTVTARIGIAPSSNFRNVGFRLAL